MIFLLNAAIKVFLILAVTLLTTRLLRSQSAALRHCVLATGILSAAITPGLSALIPGWTWNVSVEAPALPPATSAVAEGTPSVPPSFVPMPLPRQSEKNAPTLRQVSSTPPPPRPWLSYSPSPVETLTLLWVAGSSISFLILLFGYARLFRIARGSRPLNSEVWTRVARQVGLEYALRRSPRLVHNWRFPVLFTWGWRSPRVMVPDSAPTWPVERIHAVLCHEFAHIRRRDWIIQLAASESHGA